MKRLLFLIALLAQPAFAELPPPGTARKGKVTVDPNNQGKVSEYDLQNVKVVERQKARAFNLKIKSDNAKLRKRIAELEGENQALRNKAPVQAGTFRIAERPQQESTGSDRPTNKKNRISVIGGYGPASLTNKRREQASGNEIEIENSPLVGGQYQRLFGDTFSVGAQITVPTIPDTKKMTYAGMLGLDF